MELFSFPQFSRFPPELRARIWRFALQQPRVHRLHVSPANEQSWALHPTETLPRSTITIRTILATCAESRLEAIRALPDTLPLANGRILRFNKSEDVICLARLEQFTVEGVIALRHPLHPTYHLDHWLEQLAKVQNLAVELRHTSFIYQSRAPDELEALPAFLAAFRGLKRFFLVPRPCPDDRETVICESGNDDDEDEDEDWVSPKDEDRSIWRDWVRGENGLGDWYRWVPNYTRWAFSNEVVETHFLETGDNANRLQDRLNNLTELPDLTSDEKKRLTSVKIKVMIHFREGVEPLYDL